MKPAYKTKAITVPASIALLNFIVKTIQVAQIDVEWINRLVSDSSWILSLNTLALSYLAYDKYTSNKKYGND